jgi:hypothetical protein
MAAMTSLPLSDRLRALAQDSEARTQTARLRDVIHDVEHALRAGVGLEAVHAELIADGFTFTIAGFKSALKRIRDSSGDVQRSPATQTARSPDAGIEPGSLAAQTPKTADSETPDGWKTIEQLRAEHPTMPRIQLTKLYAQQYDRPALTGAKLDELKRKLGHT